MEKKGNTLYESRRCSIRTDAWGCCPFPWRCLSSLRIVNRSNTRNDIRRGPIYLPLRWSCPYPILWHAIGEHCPAQPDNIALGQQMTLDTLIIDEGAIRRA